MAGDIVYPGLLVLALFGISACGRFMPQAGWLQDVLLAMGLIFPAIFSFAYINQRYAHDFFPVLAVASALEIAFLDLVCGGAGRKWLSGTAIALMLWGTAAGWAMTIEFQRERNFSTAEVYKAEFRKFREEVDRRVNTLLGHGGGSTLE